MLVDWLAGAIKAPEERQNDHAPPERDRLHKLLYQHDAPPERLRQSRFN